MILKLGLDFDSGWLILDGIDELTTKTTVGVALFIKQPAVTEKQIGSNYNISHLVNFYQSSIDCDTYIKDFSDDTWRIIMDPLSYSNFHDREKSDKDPDQQLREIRLNIIDIKFKDEKKTKVPSIITTSTGYLLNDEGKTIQHIKRGTMLNIV